MATLVFKNAQFVVNSVDLSDHVQSLELNYSADLPDFTAMGSTTRKRKPGILDWSVSASLFNDFAASNVDATLFPLIGSTAFSVTMRPDNSARGSTNPEYSGNCVLESYNPLAGSVGDALVAAASFQASGDLSRVTSST